MTWPSDFADKILCGEVMERLKELPDNSVHCVVTSPPYYGLRDYGIEGQIGLEKTPDEYIAKMVEVFREVWRVLHPSGTLWLNMGDSYCGYGDYRGNKSNISIPEIYGSQKKPQAKIGKPKDLLMMPFRVAMALQADGWWLRSVMPWGKRNSMPESVTDRPATAVEYMFLLTKSQHYFYDNEAVRINRLTDEGRPDGIVRNRDYNYNSKENYLRNRIIFNGPKSQKKRNDNTRQYKMRYENPSGRNFRNSDFFFQSWQGLWEEDGEPLAFIVNPLGFKEAHFATFPERLVEPCIKAGTSEKGCCLNCGEMWVRITKPTEEYSKLLGKVKISKEKENEIKKVEGKLESASRIETFMDNKLASICADYQTIGWRQNCKCEAKKEPVKCIILDPFMGAGTVAVVAKKLFRSYVGIELNPQYIKMADKRIETECGTLF